MTTTAQNDTTADRKWTLEQLSCKDAIEASWRDSNHWVIPFAVYAATDELNVTALALWVPIDGTDIRIAPVYCGRRGLPTDTADRPYVLRVARRQVDDVWRAVTAISLCLILDQTPPGVGAAFRRAIELKAAIRGFWENEDEQ